MKTFFLQALFITAVLCPSSTVRADYVWICNFAKATHKNLSECSHPEQGGHRVWVESVKPPGDRNAGAAQKALEALAKRNRTVERGSGNGGQEAVAPKKAGESPTTKGAPLESLPLTKNKLPYQEQHVRVPTEGDKPKENGATQPKQGSGPITDLDRMGGSK